MSTTILVIDDDRKLNELLRTYLQPFGMDLVAATHPDEGMALLRKTAPSLVILDLMLPERDGFAVCREIRRDSPVPIIMLTARGDLPDRIAGLEIGADDYLPKPFEPRELVARIHTVLRRMDGTRARSPLGDRLRAGDLLIDLRTRRAWLNGHSLELTTTEFELLALFLQHAGAVLTRETIMDHIRGIDWEAYNRSIDVAMSRLRHKLKDDPKRPAYFKTIWGTGYLFLPVPQPVSEEPPGA